MGGSLNVAVVGASGYAGGELLRLLTAHPRTRLALVTSERSAGQPVSAVFPHLSSRVSLSFEPLDADTLCKRADVVFLALPHTKAFESAALCHAAGTPVVDLSADFRLRDAAIYQQWYEVAHPYPDLLGKAVYGLPEIYRTEIKGARLVAAPGCYPTAAILELAPLIEHNLIELDAILIDAKSGISGAGRSPSLPHHFPEAHDSVTAYKIGAHRHIPEIEQVLTGLRTQGSLASHPQENISVTFTPHIVPMNRGILSTAYCRLRHRIPLADIRELYRGRYNGEPFLRFRTDPSGVTPHHVAGSNFCDLGVFSDARTGWLVCVAALDNLVKGAAGQAIQAMNLMLGWPEDMGLQQPGFYP